MLRLPLGGNESPVSRSAELSQQAWQLTVECSYTVPGRPSRYASTACFGSNTRPCSVSISKLQVSMSRRRRSGVPRATRGRQSSKQITSFLEQRPLELRLADDRQEGADAQFAVIWHQHGDRRAGHRALHHHVIAALADELEIVLLEDATDVAAREDTSPTQPRPRPW